MITVHKYTFHCFLSFVYTVFLIYVDSTSDSPPPSPDWDALLSVPIHKDFLRSFWPSEVKSYNQKVVHDSRSNSDITSTNQQSSFSNASMHIKPTLVSAKGKATNKVNKLETRNSNLTEEEREANILAKKKRNAGYQRTRREKLKRPENAKKLELMRKVQNQYNIEYRRKLKLDVRSGNASEKRIESLLKIQKSDRERKRKKLKADKQTRNP